jgi:hypothetical protein
MTSESHPAWEFLPALQFVERALGRLGATSVAELDPRDKALIGLAFQLDQCDADELRVRQLGLNEEQSREVWEHLVARGAQMLTLCEVLIGFEGNYQGLDVERLLAP